MKFKRIFLIVLDSLGIGEADDAAKFNDEGANTLGNIFRFSGLEYTNLNNLGLKNLVTDYSSKTNAFYTKAIPISNGKDTLTGHLEMMGIETVIPFKTFTKTGFPKELIDELEARTNRKVIGNCSASGTEIIEKLGVEHIKTGSIIVYTSADSVLQIAAHESIIPISELYKICSIARELTLKEEWKVGRIIARPFTGQPGAFVRTGNRHDYALNPVSNTVLDNLKNKNIDVISIGKISDIFNNCGITKSIKTKDNEEGVKRILDTLYEDFTGLCFANLNDFDSKYGHRRDLKGDSICLKKFDDSLPYIIDGLKSDDLLIITADHGNDPLFIGSDHTRENVPVFIYSKSFTKQCRLENLKTFASIGYTIADNFEVDKPVIGESILNKLV